MALTQGNFIGFESGDLTEISVTSGTPQIENVVVRTGSHALKIASGDSGVCAVDPFLNNGDAGNNYIIGFSIRFSDTTPAQPIVFCKMLDTSLSNIHLQLRLATNGDLELFDVDSQLVGSVTTPFTDNTEHYIEIYWERANSAVAEVFVDDVSVIGPLSAEDFLNGTNEFGIVSIEGVGSANSDVYFDDVYCLSGATAASDRLGPIEVYGWKHDKTGATPDGGSGGTAGVDLDTDAWEFTINAAPTSSNGSGEYRGVGDRGTVDWSGPAKLGISVDAGSFFADVSDAGPTDNDDVWFTKDNVFDGDIATVASVGVPGSRTSNELRGAGVNLPGSGDSFTNVKVRMFGNSTVAESTGNIEIFTDGEGELLGTIIIKNTPLSRWTVWQQLTVPSGGWTRAKVQALEFILFATGTTGMICNSIEVMTTDAVANDADILATKAHLNLDRDGGGGTTHIIGLSHSGDGNNATEFNDNDDFGPLTQTPAFYSVIQTASAKLPSKTQNIRAGFGTLGAQDVHMYDGFVMILHKPPAGGAGFIVELSAASVGSTAQALDLISAFEAELTAAGVAITPQDLNVIAVSQALLSAASVALSPQDLTLISAFVVALSDANVATAPQDINTVAAFEAELSAAGVAMTPQDLNAVNAIQVLLSAAAVAMSSEDLTLVSAFLASLSTASAATTPQDLNIILAFEAGLTAASVAMTPQDLNFIAASEVLLSIASVAMSSQDFILVSAFVAALTAASVATAPQDLDIIAVAQARLSAASVAVTPQDLNVVAGFIAQMSAATVVITPQSLNYIAAFIAELSTQTVATAAKDIDITGGFSAQLSAASASMSPQDLNTIAAFIAQLSTAIVSTSPQDLDVIAIEGFIAELTAASVAMSPQGINLVAAFIAELSTAAVVMAAQDFNLISSFQMQLSAASVAITPQDLNTVAAFMAELSTAGVAMTPQDLDTIAAFIVLLSAPEVVTAAQDIEISGGFAAELSAALVSMTGLPLTVVDVVSNFIYIWLRRHRR